MIQWIKSSSFETLLEADPQVFETLDRLGYVPGPGALYQMMWENPNYATPDVRPIAAWLEMANNRPRPPFTQKNKALKLLASTHTVYLNYTLNKISGELERMVKPLDARQVATCRTMWITFVRILPKSQVMHAEWWGKALQTAMRLHHILDESEIPHNHLQVTYDGQTCAINLIVFMSISYEAYNLALSARGGTLPVSYEIWNICQWLQHNSFSIPQAYQDWEKLLSVYAYAKAHAPNPYLLQRLHEVSIQGLDLIVCPPGYFPVEGLKKFLPNPELQANLLP